MLMNGDVRFLVFSVDVRVCGNILVLYEEVVVCESYFSKEGKLVGLLN
jgi:hypothetical protein